MSKKVRLIINNAFVNNEQVRVEKFAKAVEKLANTMQIDTTLQMVHKEQMLPVMQNAVDSINAEYAEILINTFKGVGQLFVGQVDLFKSRMPKLPKGIYNPKTGLPLKQSDWNKITKAVDNYLSEQTKDLAEKMAMKGASLGAVVDRLEKVKNFPKVESLSPTDVRITSRLPKKFDFITVKKHFDWKPEAEIALRFRVDNIANYITDINNNAKTSIKRILIDGLQQQKTSAEVARGLFEEHAALNRDWVRIAQTEMQNSFADGQLATELSDTEPGIKIYMIGVGSAGACKICFRDIIGKVVRLLPRAPGGGVDMIDDPYTNTVIWPGKSSIGHGAKEQWAAIVRHPHCACRWLRFYPDM